ncbi:MAG: hypothetical protein IKB34_02595 [Clostridia bacterium]|nr:hypothetical protein [Clostridia bacterium]
MSIMKKFSFLLVATLVLCVLCSLMSFAVFADEAACQHSYDNNCDTTCNLCGETREITHAYDNECDTECNVCKTTRKVSHVYDNGCDTECNVCKNKRTTQHAYDNLDDPTCNNCNEVRKVRGPVKKWWDESNQVIGYIVAGLVFVGGIAGIYFWIPRTKEPKRVGGKRK